MLWYKSWLETRYRLVWSLLLGGLTIAMQYSSLQGTIATSGSKPVTLALLRFMTAWAGLTFITMAGGGIVTQTLRATRGIHGSMLYTLTLPVSRLRMLMMRAGMGWLQSVGIITIFGGVLWVLYPPLRVLGTPWELVEQLATVIACASVLYFLSVLLSTFLDDQGRAIGSMFAFFLIGWFSIHDRVPASIDIVRATAKYSPLLTHSMPWTPIGFSLGLSAVLLFAALQVVRMREY